MKTIAALYDDERSARDAMEALMADGFAEDRIQLHAQESASRAEKKPGFLKRLFGIGMPKDDADVYAEGVRRGNTLLMVDVGDDEIDIVEAQLERFDPIDVERRASAWREQGWSGYDESAQPYSAAEIDRDRQLSRKAEERIPVVEEQVRVGKEAVRGGKVRVRAYVQEIPVSEDVELRSERVVIERVPGSDRAIDSADAFEERSIEVETFSEEPVVQKEARVVEEVVVKKDVDVRKETVQDTVKRTQVEIDEDAKRSPSGR